MLTSPIPTPTLVRLEYLTRDGWVVGHKAMNLLHPERFVQRLLDRGKFGRATALDEELQPTGQVWQSDVDVDPERLTKTDTAIPALSCIHCSQQHGPPYDGMCLL